jgi:glycosyltransferase involved in cell wall biosynthesis
MTQATPVASTADRPMELKPNGMPETPSICFISTSPRTLWLFYRGLLAQLRGAFASCSVVTPYMPELDELVRQCHCTPHVVPISRAISPLKDLRSIFRIARHLRRGRFAVAHAHTPKGGLVGILAATLARTPVRVYTMHGLPLETAKGIKYYLLWLADWCTCKCATRVLAVSPSLRQRIIAAKLCPADKIEVLGQGSACGLDPDYFKRTPELIRLGSEIRKRHGIDSEAVVLGYVGRIGPEKGVHELVDAFTRLSQRHNLRLLLIGEDEELHGALSEATRRELRSNPRIIKLDHAQDVRPFYAAIDIVVLPTLREGISMVLLEAGAMNLPAVANRVTGCVDAIEDQVTGLLVDPHKPDQLVDALSGLIRDPTRRAEMGRQGRLRVEQCFAGERLIAEHLKLYERLVIKA